MLLRSLQINNIDTDVVANVAIINEGPFDAQLVLHLYYEFPNSTVVELPIHELLQFTKVTFEKNEQKTIAFSFRVRDIPNANRQQLPDVIHFWVGNSRDQFVQGTPIVQFS